MATRKHSIIVPINFGNVADLTSGVTSSIGTGTPTIYIPENAGSQVTFSSAMLFLSFQDTSTATGLTSSALAVTVALGASGASANAVTSILTAAATLENKGGMMGPLDFTSYFNNSWGATGTTSKTVTVSVNLTNTGGTGTASRGVYAYFELTYTYSDTEAMRIQTVAVAYESSTTTVGATPSFATVATIPDLTGATGWLSGYSGPTIRHRWIELQGNAGDGATTDFNLLYRFDGGVASVLPTREMALNSGTRVFYQIDLSALSTNATHTVELASSLASRFPNLVVTEYISFEYTVAGTTRVLNYVTSNFEFTSPIAGTTAGNVHAFTRNLLVPEPGTITTLNCAAQVRYAASAATTAQFRSGNQVSYRAYAMSVATCAGDFSFQHRLDPASGATGSFSLTRGENLIQLYLYRSAGAMTNVSGQLKFLYLSDVSSLGVDAHTHTIYSFARGLNFTVTGDNFYSDSVIVPETDYWFTSIGQRYYAWYQTALTVVNAMVRLGAGEGAGTGWRGIYEDLIVTDNVLGYYGWFVRARDEFKRYPRDPDSERIDLQTARTYRTTSSTTFRFGISWVVSYHSITASVSGTISGSAGGTVSLSLYKQNTDNEYELFDQTTRAGNGTYSFTVYDDTVNYYVSAYESDTLKGLSKQETPTTGFDIDLAGGGGGEFFF